MSGRGLTSPQQTAATGAHSTCVPLIEALFDSGPLRGSLGGMDLTVSGNSYPALNKLRSIEVLNESLDSIEGVRITLDGVDAGIIAILAAEPYRGRTLNIYQVWLDANLEQIGAPTLLFPGRMSAISMTEQDGSTTLVVEAEHFEKELGRPREIRFNDADQRQLYSDDRGFELVEQMTSIVLVWPSKEALQR